VLAVDAAAVADLKTDTLALARVLSVPGETLII
jgi:hypothetical protein